MRPDFRISPSIVDGETSDIYFIRTREVLAGVGLDPVVTMEFFPSRPGILCGIEEAKQLLAKVLPADSVVEALAEGEPFAAKEVLLRITAHYSTFGIYETALLGMLAHGSAWATAARECVEAAAGIPIVSFGARHVHPNVAAVMDYAAVIGGCISCSSVAGASLAGVVPSGTMPHSLILIVGDTVEAARYFDQYAPAQVPRIVLVDTFKDEVEETLRVAKALHGRLEGGRLDTPSERGRVTAPLVAEVRAWLDLEGFQKVKIMVSGGLDPDRIRYFVDHKSAVAAFGVGSYISGARPIDHTADIHAVEGRPVAKRGRLPGLTPNPRLQIVDLTESR
jgi:nicotinate phosphoribosyltransferase